MLKVAGCWELGWSAPITEYDLWAFPLKEFEVDEFIMTPVSGINKKVTEYSSIEDAVKANPTLTPVFIDEHGECDLEEYDHPENALYILGKANFSPMRALRIEDVESVRVKTPTGMGRMWPHQVVTLLLYDRSLKHA